jgi:carboxymethylenebutenolidase
MTTTRQETVTLPDGEQESATLVLPDAGSGPGILLFQEIFGVNDFVVAKAEQLAALGYVVLCPDVFHRVQPGVALPHTDESLRAGMSLGGRYSQLDEETRTADLLAAASRLRELDEVTGRVAAIGYCLGGTLAYAVAARTELDACVSYYGSGVPALLEAGERVDCPTLFHFGGSDPYLPFDQIVEVIKGYAGQHNVEVLIQPGAGHAFENLLSPRFADPVAAARSWPVTVAFLEAELAG